MIFEKLLCKVCLGQLCEDTTQRKRIGKGLVGLVEVRIDNGIEDLFSVNDSSQ